MKIEEIQKAIVELSVQERAALQVWFDEFTGDDWDRKMEADANSGKLDKLFESSVQDFKATLFAKL